MTPPLVLGLILLAVFAWRFHREPRRLSNAVLLFFGSGALILGLLGDLVPEPIALLVLVSPLLVVGLAVLLIVDGVTVLRRERTRLANALSLLAGLGIIAVITTVVVAFLVGYQEQEGVLVVAGFSLLAVAGYIGFVFTMLALYAVVYSRATPAPGHTGIIVLGAAVPRGTVPPLLANRLDKAVELYRREAAAGYAPLLVVSGGQGPDEPVPEAHAMAAYLREQGVPDATVVEEDRSTTTRENLLFSRRLLADLDADGRLLVVTSGYHALRAAVQARRLRIPAQVCGAKTARYYVANAFLREFVALLADHKVLHMVMVGIMIATPPLLLLA